MRNCKNCTTSLEGLNLRSDALYCSDTCKEKARYNKQPTKMLKENQEPQDWKSYIIRELERQKLALESKLESVEKKYEALKEVAAVQKNDLLLADREYQLKLDTIKLEGKNSLGGIIENASKHEPLMESLATGLSRLMGTAAAVPQQTLGTPETPKNEFIERITQWYNDTLNENQQKHFWNFIVAVSQKTNYDQQIAIFTKHLKTKSNEEDNEHTGDDLEENEGQYDDD